MAAVIASCGGAASSSGIGAASSTSPIITPGGSAASSTVVVGGVPIAAPTVSLPASVSTTVTPAGAATATADPASAARRTFDTWLSSVDRQDVSTALATSTGPAAALTALQLVADEIASGNGGSITVQAQNESLRSTTVTPGAIAFDGHVDLITSIRSSRGTTQTSSRIDGPIRVVSSAGNWHVADFLYGGQPLAHYPEDASQTVSGLHVAVAFALSNANLTSLVVGVEATTRNRSATLMNATLTLASGTQERLRAVFGDGVVAGILEVARVADRPARLDLTFRDASGNNLAFGIPLPGQPSSPSP